MSESPSSTGSQERRKSPVVVGSIPYRPPSYMIPFALRGKGHITFFPDETNILNNDIPRLAMHDSHEYFFEANDSYSNPDVKIFLSTSFRSESRDPPYEKPIDLYPLKLEKLRFRVAKERPKYTQRGKFIATHFLCGLPAEMRKDNVDMFLWNCGKLPKYFQRACKMTICGGFETGEIEKNGQYTPCGTLTAIRENLINSGRKMNAEQRRFYSAAVPMKLRPCFINSEIVGVTPDDPMTLGKFDWEAERAAALRAEAGVFDVEEKEIEWWDKKFYTYKGWVREFSHVKRPLPIAEGDDPEAKKPRYEEQFFQRPADPVTPRPESDIEDEY
ncbi:unnamed protein product [Caenorhabditis auriculariae]|uniref:Uncharacterized protein n=1 Tax=Caenorhabditis auriculariae TaxID=2777116 RepID=A0A8S1H031_9PELO|nr:unnamed protein product [Caenorhabditis auriculariae]